GDVRRAFLKGATMMTPLDDYIMRTFVSVGPAASRAEVLEMMQSRWLSQVPILDETGRLIGLHTLHEILGASPRPNWAVIMAGGGGGGGAAAAHTPTHHTMQMSRGRRV